MTKPVKKAATETADICLATVKWFGDNEKAYGFLHRADGEDIFIHQDRVDEAKVAGVLVDSIRSGDRLHVTFEMARQGLAVKAILAYEPVPEERGYVLRFSREGDHAIVKVDGRDEDVFLFCDIAKRAELTLGDEVMVVIAENNRGPKAMAVRKTGQKVELAPRTPKRQMLPKRGEQRTKQPQALYRGIYGVVKSYSTEKGFGFITIDPEAETGKITGDLFVCFRAVKAADFLDQALNEGDLLQFDIFPGREAGKYEAQNLRFVEHAAGVKATPKPASTSHQKAPVYEALTGVVDWKDPEARYGFIVLDQPLPGFKPDMFLHVKDVVASGLTVVGIVDARVTFDVVTGRKPGELQATNLRDVNVPAAIGDLFDEAAAIAAQ